MQSVTIVKNQENQRLDKFLKKYFPQAGTGFLYKMLRKKNITLNGKKAEGSEILALGDTICFFFSQETFNKFRTKEGTSVSGVEECQEYIKAYESLRGISILYEDAEIVILNKPAGILTQKADKSDLSLNEWLIGYLLQEQKISPEELQSFHPSVCNRLDRNTSGIVLCGKSLAGSQLLSQLIKQRVLRKFYRTICVGNIEKGQLLEGYLVKNPSTNKVSVCQNNAGDVGAYIKTAYNPLATNGQYTLLEVELITGKTHQIRAHLASVSHPIIGDNKYGNTRKNQQIQREYSAGTLRAQLLHAARIQFPEDFAVPVSLRGLTITAPYPQLFEKLLTGMDLKKCNPIT